MTILQIIMNSNKSTFLGFLIILIDNIISIFLYQRSNDREPRFYDVIDFHLPLSLDNLFTGMFCRKLDY